MKIDLPELQGDPIYVAREKCKLAAEQVNGRVITEDTSLVFNALGDMPGPYIKWFLDSCKHEGLNRILNGFDDKSCYALTVVAYFDGQEIHVFEGRTAGKVVPARGEKAFGWDPIFECTEGEVSGKTYAEMSAEEKNSISHRGRSFRQLKEHISKNNGAIFY